MACISHNLTHNWAVLLYF